MITIIKARTYDDKQSRGKRQIVKETAANKPN